MRVRIALVGLLVPFTLARGQGAARQDTSVQWTAVDSLKQKGQLVIVVRDARTGAPVRHPMICFKESKSSVPFWVGSENGVLALGGNLDPSLMHLRILGPRHEARDITVDPTKAIGSEVVVPLQSRSAEREPECKWSSSN